MTLNIVFSVITDELVEFEKPLVKSQRLQENY
jgi:hypothetical protein